MAEVNKVGSSSVQPTQSKSSSQQATKTQENSKVQQTTETQKPEDKDKTKETQKPEDKDKTEKDPEKEKLQEEIEKLKKELEELKKKLEESKNRDSNNGSESAPPSGSAPSGSAQAIQNPQNPNDPNQLIIQDITAVLEAQKNGGQNLQQAVNKLKQDYSMIKSMGIQLKPEVDTLAQQIIQQFSGGNIQNPQIATGLNQAQTVNPTQNLQSSQFNNIV